MRRQITPGLYFCRSCGRAHWLDGDGVSGTWIAVIAIVTVITIIILGIIGISGFKYRA